MIVLKIVHEVVGDRKLRLDLQLNLVDNNLGLEISNVDVVGSARLRDANGSHVCKWIWDEKYLLSVFRPWVVRSFSRA